MKFLHWLDKKLSLNMCLVAFLHNGMKFLHWLDKKLSTAENFMLAILLTAMVSLAFLLVVLRNIFHTGIYGADEFLRHLVLLVAFFGAAQAASLQKHINIDIFSKLLKDFYKNIAAIIINAFSLVITFFLALAAWEFVMIEREIGGIAIFGIRTWMYQIIIPLGFLLIGYRFLLHFLDALIKAVRRKCS